MDRPSIDSSPSRDLPPARPFPSFREAFQFWLKLGFISFGGPAGQIAIMHEVVVDQKKWVSESRFLHALNYCMILPGPEAQQLATYIGWLLHGIKGGITAGILFILPSVLILLGLSIAYVTYGTLPVVASVFYMMKPAVVAIVIVAMIRIGRKSLHSTFHVGVALSSFIALYFLELAFPWIILATLALALAAVRFFPQVSANKRHEESDAKDELDYCINQYSAPVTKGLGWLSLVRKVSAGVFLWLCPLIVFSVTLHDTFWNMLAIFFTKAAFVTFGGAYAVLPYVAQVSVEDFKWLTDLQMIDGLALGESTPGPLIMVLAFVGFMAGYNSFNASLISGSLGLFVTTYYTFLPSFIFILVGAPWVEKTKENKKLTQVLSIVTAAITGVIFNLAIYLGKAVLISSTSREVQWLPTLWLIISFVALQRFKVNLVLWIIISALAGVLYFFVANVW